MINDVDSVVLIVAPINTHAFVYLFFCIWFQVFDIQVVSINGLTPEAGIEIANKRDGMPFPQVI